MVGNRHVGSIDDIQHLLSLMFLIHFRFVLTHHTANILKKGRVTFSLTGVLPKKSVQKFLHRKRRRKSFSQISQAQKMRFCQRQEARKGMVRSQRSTPGDSGVSLMEIFGSQNERFTVYGLDSIGIPYGGSLQWTMGFPWLKLIILVCEMGVPTI